MRSSWQKLAIPNRSGLKLATLICRAKSEHRGRSPVVVVCHGFTGSKEGSGRALEMGENLANRGINCLLFDFTGCGESEGLWEEISLSRHLADLADVVQWCRGTGFTRVILNGRSFGGAAALCYAAADRSIAGVCTWSTPARPAALFSAFAGGEVSGPAEETVKLSGEEGTVQLRKGFFYDLLKYEPLHCAARIAPRPLLIIHGTADEVVPPGDAGLLASAAAEPKQLLLVEGADHRFSDRIDQVWAAFFNWLQHRDLH